MSLQKLHTFIRKIARVLYSNTLLQVPQEERSQRLLTLAMEEKIRDDPALKDQLTIEKDPVSLIIPLVIDFIIAKELAEERSLAYILQIEEHKVRKALQLLERHGILSSEEMYFQVFKRRYQGKLGLTDRALFCEDPQQQNQMQQLRRSDTKVTIFFFNIHLMYVLIARLHVLEKQLNSELDKRQQLSSMYFCPKARMNKCPNNDVIDEFAFHTNRTCRLCESVMEKDKQSIVSTEVAEGCKQVVEDLKKELAGLRKYRIPPQFFGHAAQQARQFFVDDKFQQFDYECINYEVEFEAKEGLPLNVGIFKRENKVERMVGQKRERSSEDDDFDSMPEQAKLTKYRERIPEIHKYYVQKVRNSDFNMYKVEKELLKTNLKREEESKEEKRAKWKAIIETAKEKGDLVSLN